MSRAARREHARDPPVAPPLRLRVDVGEAIDVLRRRVGNGSATSSGGPVGSTARCRCGRRPSPRSGRCSRRLGPDPDGGADESAECRPAHAHSPSGTGPPRPMPSPPGFGSPRPTGGRRRCRASPQRDDLFVEDRHRLRTGQHRLVDVLGLDAGQGGCALRQVSAPCRSCRCCDTTHSWCGTVRRRAPRRRLRCPERRYPGSPALGRATPRRRRVVRICSSV